MCMCFWIYIYKYISYSTEQEYLRNRTTKSILHTWLRITYFRFNIWNSTDRTKYFEHHAYLISLEFYWTSHLNNWTIQKYNAKQRCYAETTFDLTNELKCIWKKSELIATQLCKLVETMLKLACKILQRESYWFSVYLYMYIYTFKHYSMQYSKFSKNKKW